VSVSSATPPPGEVHETAEHTDANVKDVTVPSTIAVPGMAKKWLTQQRESLGRGVVGREIRLARYGQEIFSLYTPLPDSDGLLFAYWGPLLQASLHRAHPCREREEGQPTMSSHHPRPFPVGLSLKKSSRNPEVFFMFFLGELHTLGVGWKVVKSR
jgi:hypothetical protein